MKCPRSPYHGHRFPPEIISHAVWHYYQFCLSFRDVEDLLAKRGIIVSYESIRQWCSKFGPEYARKLKRRQGRLGDTWFLDEVFVSINGKRQYLWRAVDQDGDVIDILVQSRRNRCAAERFFIKLLKGQGKVPFRIVTDKLKSYGAALRTIMPSVNHDTNSVLEQSSRSLAPTDPAAGKADEKVQVPGSDSTISFRSRSRSESFPTRSAPAESGASSDAPRTIFRDLDCGYHRMIDRRGSDLLSGFRNQLDSAVQALVRCSPSRIRYRAVLGARRLQQGSTASAGGER